MAIYEQRFPTKAEYFRLFLISSLPVHVWAIIALMKRSSTLAVALNIFEQASVAAYVLVFALFESMVFFGMLFILSLLAPARYFRSRLVPAGVFIIILATISVILIQMYNVWEIETISYTLWAGLWGLFAIAASLASIYWLSRDHRLEALIESAVERLSVLSIFYLFFDFVGVFIVLIRNIV